MDYIYARVSKDGLQTTNQVSALRTSYPEATVIEEITSGYNDKPLLEQLLAKLRKGDRLIVYALDRLGRHARKALVLLEDLESRGVIFVSKREGLDMSTPTGKFMAHI